MASSIRVKNIPKNLFNVLIMFYIVLKSSNAQLTPALFVFGDSFVDVGNNNYLAFSIRKANFPHNGIDFPKHKPTGRFSNGKNVADFLAEKLGLVSPPPYLELKHMKSNNFSAGVNFASGGAGIIDDAVKLFQQSLSMNKQIEYFEVVQGKLEQQLGEQGAQKLLSQSLFAIVIGSNDIFSYTSSSNSSQMKNGTSHQYANSMVLDFKRQLKELYELGARKFAILGVPSTGCCPGNRDKKKANEYPCDEEANMMASNYNKGLVSFLKDYQTQLTDFRYSYFDTYRIFFSNFIQQPATFGFKEAKAACCGLGKLKAEFACTPISTYCSNRSDYVFWDLYHPTEKAARIIIETAFDGPQTYAFPVNLKQLVSTSSLASI